MSKQSHLLHLHLSTKNQVNLVDRIVLAASLIAPVTGVPQAVDVFRGNNEGVSLLSWLGFIIFSLLFLTYGLIHKVKPMIVSNSLWFVVELAVVTGLLLNR